MKNLNLITVSVLLLSINIVTLKAQEGNTVGGLEIFGSVDTYFKYDFDKHTNISSSGFTGDHNSVSLGMIDLGLRKSVGKASFLGEVSFGPRGQYRSLLNGDGDPDNGDNSFHIQNLAVSYSLTDKWSVDAGFMGTFVGYEVISPSANFHYSTSYLFGAGPFQNAGIKTSYSFTDNIQLMVGLFNDWNEYQDLNGVSHFGSQLAYSPTENSSLYLNFLTGISEGGETAYTSGTLIDLVGSYSFSDKVSLGLNAADYTQAAEGGYSGVAIYPQYNFTENIAVGARAEYFKVKDVEDVKGDDYTSFTLSGNFKHNGFAFIPEIRFDNSNNDVFLKSDLVTPKKNAAQFSLALVYSF
ncbi:porin [Sphingobacterium lumbrici]|uniref:porin n=1 Tax=Sphingobacterium lumbrici TaxID=2559600 RepID=UPI00112A0F43|nr:porin [Sphingobacterium lumbrici]